MADPVTLLILVAAGEQPDLTRAMASSSREALGAGAVVVVREVPGEPTDADALATERSEGANAVVEFSWADAQHQQAFVKMHYAPERRWIERSIGFLRFDADAERGRTIGFTIASILPQSSAAGGPPAAATGQPVKEIQGEGAASNAGPSTKEHAAPLVPVTPSSPALAPPSSTTPRRLNVAVDVLADGSVAIGGTDPDDVGGAVGVQWFPIRELSVRVGGALRAGYIIDATSGVLVALGCAGVAFHPWRTSIVRPFGASIRAEGLIVDELISHFPSGKSVLRGGVAFVADGLWRFAPDVELVLGAGIEDVFGTTYIDTIHGQQPPAATLWPLSVVVEGGLRLEF